MEAIIAQDLRKTYPSEVLALAGLSLRAETGTMFALAGPNGAGNSVGLGRSE
jgi:ABC-type multidrug transport system ATPase subunit